MKDSYFILEKRFFLSRLTSSETESAALFLLLREFKTLRPPLVAILALNPSWRMRFTLWGW